MGKAFGQVNIAETLSLMGDELASHWDRIVGMGLFWAWLQVVLSVPAFAPGSNPLSFIEGFEPQNAIWTTSLAFSVATLLGVRCSSRQFDQVASGVSLQALSCGLSAFGAIALAVSYYDGQQTFAALLGIVATGIGGAMWFVLWGCCLCRHSTPLRMLIDTVAYSAMTAVLFLVSLVAPVVAVQAAAALTPFASIALLRHANFYASFDISSDGVDEQRVHVLPSKIRGLDWADKAMFLMAFFIGFAYGCMRGFAALQHETVSFVLATGIVVGIAVAGLLLFFTAFAYRRSDQIYLICEVALPLLAAGFLMLVLLDVSAPVALAALTVGHSYFYYLFWVHFVSVARRTGISPSRAVATGLAAFLGSTLLSSLMNDFLVAAGFAGLDSVNFVSTVMIYVTVVLLAATMAKAAKRGREADELQGVDAWVARESAQRGLTERESEVLRLLASGLDRAAIRKELAISNDTLKSHIRHIYSKLEIHSKSELSDLIARSLSDRSQ